MPHLHVLLQSRLRKDKKHASRKASLKAVVPDKLQNQVYQYIATVSIGTPAQETEAAIDTGSSDLWVFSSSSGLKYSFNSSKSSTYKFLNNDFSIQYVSGSAQGDWNTDNVGFGSDSVKNQQFATVDQPAQQGEDVGVFGIGQVSQETTGGTYSNFPASLKVQGVTTVNAYSLYLDSISAQNGSSLTFGGVDTSKYTGQLYTVPFTSTVQFSVDFTVAGSQSSGVLDSGTSLIYLDQSITDQIAQTYGAQWNDTEKVYLLPSGSKPASQEPLVFSFSGAEVKVPVSELIVSDGQSGEQTLMILPTTQSQGVVLLGDSFLRSAYVVYHLDANIAGIAQSNWSPGASKIVDITDNTIPGAVPAPQSSSSGSGSSSGEGSNPGSGLGSGDF